MSEHLHLVNPELLPPQVRMLVRLIGLPQTLRLLEARGGIPTYIPMQPGHATELHKIISAEALAALARSDLAGKTIELPKSDKIRLQIRNHAIRNARREMSAASTARMFGLTRRQVINVNNAGREEDGTGDLFDNTGERA